MQPAMTPRPLFASATQLPPSALQAQAMALIADAQTAAAAFFAAGVLGALVPELLMPALAPAAVYGRLLLPAAAPGSSGNGNGGGGGDGGSVVPPSLLLHFSLALQRAWPVPKGRAFTGFYVLAAAVNAFALLLAVRAGHPPWSLALLALFQLHAARRLAECLWLHRFSRGARMSAPLVLAGALHYVFTSFALLPARPREWRPYSWRGAEAEEAALDGAVGGATFGTALDALVAALGLALFLGGSLMQHLAHRQLAALRGDEKRDGGGDGGSSGGVVGGGAGGFGGGARGAGIRDTDDSSSASAARSRRAPQPRPPADSAASTGAIAEPGKDRDNASSAGSDGSDAATAAAATAAAAAAAASTAASAAVADPFPRGGLVEVTLSPHYTAELAIYGGLMLLRGAAAALEEEARALHVGFDATGAPLLAAAPARQPAGLAARAAAPLLLAWVACNLGVTALRTKRWYATAFPGERAARETAAFLPLLL